ncbi:MMPL family transporter [Lichenibacterium ramalinae]|uniref:Hopanoid biosynthesis-associated RND transporter HpnN n=1 Tax=Lichenibacterium ramalinae TaxID=2316527 RepID=A0A4Q2RIZ7_9HYPH|nr:MMPL family transporter [Lichenibacterium ramalinae]RYB07035.1 hopanoid biosynthesis-associated RND transporter HpnN [Lichenibacterium ramalinae]
MLTRIVARIVAACSRHAMLVVLLSALLTVLSAWYAATHFAINTDSNTLIASDLPWRQRQEAFNKAFPQNDGLILMVLDGSTPEAAQDAADRFVARLKDDTRHFDFVRLPPEQAFFGKDGLLFQPVAAVRQAADQLGKAQPLLATLAADPSLRGLSQMVGMMGIGIEQGKIPLDQVQPFFSKMADSIEGALAGRVVPFSFQALAGGNDGQAYPNRRFVQLKPKLDYGALEPGADATDVVRTTIDELHLTPDHGVTVRLTGQIPLDDQEFGTLKEGFALNSILTVLAVVFLLWLALKSGRLIVAVFLATAVGLVMTAALGLLLVGALNLISVAFAVLFIGIGVDFGIQFSVRYRDERFIENALLPAIVGAGAKAGRPLLLAAAATTAGFFSFLPTDYKGVSELGLIAGNGMIIAFVVSITLLPALLQLFNPPSESKEVGYAFLKPVDHFLENHRLLVIVATLGPVILMSPLLFHVRFDFNPLNLNSDKVESVATIRDLATDASTTPYKVDVLEPTLARANAVAAEIAKLPEVGNAKTLDAYVPADQEPKLQIIADLKDLLGPSLDPGADAKPAPTDAESVDALKGAVVRLDRAAAKGTGQAQATTKRLSDAFGKLAAAPASARDMASLAFVPAMHLLIDQLRGLISAETVTLANLPASIRGDWVTQGGQARIEVTPKDLSTANDNLQRFGDAVLAVAPDATGQPIVIKDSGDSVIHAFIEAGIWALASIAVLLYLALRRITDVLLTLVPLILAGLLTLEVTVVIGMPLNFANIIAIPLLLGLGVAFKIYFVLAWRAGQRHVLQSSLTRAVFFSASCTAVAFGSLWASSHPGTSSMGKLLALSLACTLVSAIFFQPALMGPPREEERVDPEEEARNITREITQAAE